MSITLEVFTYSNGDMAEEVFNAIAAFFSTDSFGSLLQICSFFAVIGTAFTFFIKRDTNSIPKWAAVYFFVPAFLCSTTTSVHITDLSDPMSNYQVDNVPVVISYPAYLSSAYMHGVTQLVEDTFHSLPANGLSSDELYARTGMMFGSKLYRLSRQNTIENTELKGFLQQYIRSCIRGDILINQKYTWEQLANAPDIFAFLANNNPSPLRRIQMAHDDYPTCKEALPRLKTMFTLESAKGLDLLGSWIYGDERVVNEAFMKAALQNSYKRYGNISRGATEITTQNMMINAIRNGLSNDAADVDNTAAAINYAYTQNKMQTTSMWAGMALQAQEFLPMLQSILFLLFSSIAFLVVCVAMLPSMTFSVLTNYVKGFVYLGTWPIFFALINFIMTTRLSVNSIAIPNLYGGITLSNVDALAEMHSRYAAMTGFLMMSVPFIVVIVIKGGASAMSSVSQQFAGMMNSVNARTSAAAASGDINLGNGQIDNYSFNNTSGNKLDTAGLDRRHGMTVQDGNGFSTTRFDSGKQVVSSQGALSNYGYDINGSQALASSMRTSASNNIQSSSGHRASMDSSIQSGYEQASNWQTNTGHNQLYGTNSSNRETASASKAFNDMWSIAETYAKNNNISQDEAWRDLSANSVSGSATVGTPFKGMTGTGVQTSTGFSGSTEETDSTNISQSESSGTNKSLQDQFTHARNTVKAYDLGDQTSDTRTQAAQELDSIAHTFRNTDSYANQASADLSEAKALNRTADQLENGSITVNENFNQPFFEYVQSREPDRAIGIVQGSNENLRQEREDYYQEFLNSPEVKAIANQYIHDDLPSTTADLRNDFAKNSDNLSYTNGQEQRITSQYQQGKEHYIEETKDKPSHFNEDEYQQTINNTANESQIIGDVVSNNENEVVSLEKVDVKKEAQQAEQEYSLVKKLDTTPETLDEHAVDLHTPTSKF
ncbi:conjugal transfer mating-pair stabilization protein TraG [uncultured Shewanella sp.]|uniref:conjugal transfer mating-pair stabilization protein TraG n=1 Tax=uncultured Shewanella sp. TaxID=173975 RepID=UPI002619616F|nr:conjugal transfer mating-pair stabilization protein TraG [uncultured Shewanella sp.]